MLACEQQTDQWLELRKRKIGASDACIIMGVSPWKTSYQLWLDKMGLTQQTEKSQAMQRGLDLEQEARDNFERLTGIEVNPDVVINPNIEWQMASLDGISEDRKTIVEIKCPGSKDHKTAIDGQIPEKYIPQLQHQMCVCGVDDMYYYSYDGNHGHLIHVRKDNKYIDKLLEKEVEFWNYMQTFTPPPLTERDYIKQTSLEWKELCYEMRQVQNSLKELEGRELTLRQKMIELSNGNNSNGSGYKVMKTIRRGNVDYSQIKELENIDLDIYRKSNIEYWKICSEKE